MDWDIAIIGAGVVGLACAERLAREGRAVLVLERHARFGQETSSRNSQVIHAGMYYPEGTLKARLCVRGNASLGAWCEAHAVPHRRVGKYIVARDDEEAELDAILARGRTNGVARLEKVSGARVTADEPRVIADVALWSPDTGIVDAHALMASLAAESRAHGCDFAWTQALVGADRKGVGYRLSVRDCAGALSTIDATCVVNAAGLDGDEVASLPGLDVDAAGYRLRYVKGSYFRLRGGGVKRLIYPVPPRSLVGLGIHLTLELDGALLLGPDVEALEGRWIDYAVDAARRDAFFTSASRYLRDLRADELSPDQSGIRPKLRGGGVRDFVVAEESARGLPGWVNLIGIESPGLTAALEIASSVAALLA